MQLKKVSRILMNARRLARQGSVEEAKRLYTKYLKLSPGNIEAMMFLAHVTARQGDLRGSAEMLKFAVALNPRNFALRAQYGITLLHLNDIDGARDSFEKALEIEPNSHLIRLHIGEIFERTGDRKNALLVYFKAIFLAQSKGEWLSDASTPLAYRPMVKRAITFVENERKALLFGHMENIKREFGSKDLERIESALSGYLNTGMVEASGDSRQQATFLYVPNLSSTPFFESSLFPMFEVLQDNANRIREEFLRSIELEDSYSPVHGHFDEKTQERLVHKGEEGSWDAMFFYRHGECVQENSRRCPSTANILEELPLVRIRGHAPEILFSVLRPGAHIKPHRGVSNLRSVVHLPLVVPEGCALHVTGEVPYKWKEGRCVAFDDTFEHEAWNRGGRLRAILLLDTWNPHLKDFECMALTRLVEAIGDFRKEWTAA